MPDRPEIPEDITQLNREQLVELEGQLLARFNELRDAEATDEVTAEMGQIAAALPQIGERVDAIDAAAAQRAEAEAAAQAAERRRAEAAERAEREAAERAEREAAEAAQREAEETARAEAARVEAERAAAEQAAEAARQEAAAQVDTPAAPDTAGQEAGQELAMAASAGRPSVADIANRAPAPTPPATTKPRAAWYSVLTAGAEIPGTSAGATFQSGSELGEAVVRRTEAIAVHSGERQAMVARAHIDAFNEPVTRSESGSAVTTRMLEAVRDYISRDEQRDVLTAAGGWCAPSETLYDMCEPEVADQLISLPEIPITRGGIQYFKSPNISDFNSALWGFCEPELITGVTKPCAEVPCPEPEEVRACVEGACLNVGLLQAKAFPEWVERYVRGVMVAHAVRISAATIARMEALSIAVNYPDTAPMLQGSGFTATLLNTLEFQIEDLRADYFLGVGDRPVVVLPRWVRSIIRADLANRLGVDLLKVTDAYIDSLFTDRGVGRIQWVKGWQTETVGAPGTQLAWPCTVKFLLYREGTFVRGLEPIIDIETLYDSALLAQNKMTRLFTEQGFLVADLCTDSRLVTIPVCPSGATHCGNVISCFNSCATTPPDTGGTVAPEDPDNP
ncbi:major capsid protein [Amycolatopsis thermophila]|uniref:Phage major capsid protein n=1 Tax=Amycolatopsis thermophila TaxID=206084 RepID=A0ABU0EMJ6_9PSEU|nr:major capsid protein [Amycolatopsis thermophila]MDQ0376500.1 hypothetical protein [Amycolatopsis thermophila]